MAKQKKGAISHGGKSGGELVIEYVPVASLSEDPANARKHGEKNLAAIEASLRRFGQRKPIVVDGRDVVIAGNGTLRAATRLGWEKIAVVRADLSPIEIAAFGIADNRTSELAEWDFPALAELIKGLKDEAFEIEELGWEPYELAPLLEGEWTPPKAGAMPEASEGKKPHPHAVIFSSEQWPVIERAVQKIRDDEQDQEITAARALELIVADFLA